MDFVPEDTEELEAMGGRGINTEEKTIDDDAEEDADDSDEFGSDDSYEDEEYDSKEDY
ncbi:hypothetical protein D3C71_2218750 [compost metagenome]